MVSEHDYDPWRQHEHFELRQYLDNERPHARCYDCRRPYETFPDLLVPNEVWEKISPTYHVGAGLLCPTCISNRCEALGLTNVPAMWASGPLVGVPYRSDFLKEEET